MLFVALLSLVVSANCSDGAVGQSESVTPTMAPGAFGAVILGPGDPIQIGVLLATSGGPASRGIESIRGVQLAVDHLDGTFDGVPGQMLGRRVEIVDRPDGCTAAAGTQAAERLLRSAALVAVIGTSCDASALGAADRTLSDEGVPLISPSNTDPALTRAGTHRPFYLRMAPNALMEGAAMADFAYEELDLRTAATIHDDDPDSEGMARAFREAFSQKGGVITGESIVLDPLTTRRASGALARVAGGAPAFVYAPVKARSCALLARGRLREPGLLGAAFGGAQGCMSAVFLEVGGRAVDGSYLSQPDLSASEAGDIYASEFVPAYLQRFGATPTPGAARAYDATNALLDAIEKASTESEGSDAITIDRVDLRDVLFQTKGYSGLAGDLSCEPTGDCITRLSFSVFQVPRIPVGLGDEEDVQPVFTTSISLGDVVTDPGS